MEFDKNRLRVKFCPCGKSNRDGKFSPLKGYDDKGFCHGCGTKFFSGLMDRNIGESVTETTEVYNEQKRDYLHMIYDEYRDSFMIDGIKSNYLLIYLSELFGKDISLSLIDKYNIGSSEQWDGATIFWQIDITSCIRTGKIIQYQILPNIRNIIGKDCKRNKNNYPPVQWVHNFISPSMYKIKQCFYGEHLLKKEPSKPVALVESEKTAVIASVYLPQYIWLASGGVSNLTTERCKVLQGRNVTLFPDLKCYNLWGKKANEISQSFKVSDLLEQKATEAEKAQGLDLADYLLRFDYRQFI